MEFLELAKIRQSVRGYLDKPVEREKIEYCLEAARLAPSACNGQPWYFIVVDDPKLTAKVAAETHGKISNFNKFADTAPVIVAVVCEKTKPLAQIAGAIKNKPFYLVDSAIAAEHLCLAAAEQGLGTCMLGWFNEKNVKNLLAVPKNRRVFLLITLGYAADPKIRIKARKQKDQIRSYNKYK